MVRIYPVLLACVFVATPILPASAQEAQPPSAARDGNQDRPSSAGQIPLFVDMGPHRRTITTDSAEAQQYFDQGLTWMYAFNHDEAIRSFLRAAERDPRCAMAWWGVAYCEGPNYNDDVMTDQRSKAVWANADTTTETSCKCIPNT